MSINYISMDKYPQLPRDLINELHRYFNKNICFGWVCNKKCCFC